jgi:uncharacterized protein (DUF2461 family)
MRFSGFPAEAITFYEGLAADNSRAYWLTNKAVYDRAVRGPMEDLLAELAEFGPFHVFRPNRDVRFAKDKTPYKDSIGAYGESQGGAEIDAIVAELEDSGLGASAIGSLKSAPRGYARDHPRIVLLRRKGLVVSREWEQATWMRTRSVVARVRDTWTTAAAMNAWLDAHVGPTTLAPDEGSSWRR